MSRKISFTYENSGRAQVRLRMSGGIISENFEFITEEMVGHRLGEFSPTKKFVRHGGKMQKEQETKAKEAEIVAARAAKEKPADAKASPAKK